MKLRGKVAIVAGGSRGIGRAVAEFLCREGARVAILARDRRELADAADEIWRATGVLPAAVACDVADFASARRAAARVAKKFQRVDILVNCAGIHGAIGPFTANRMEDWGNAVAVDLLGTVHMCKAILPYMMKRRGGAIVNFSGGGAAAPRPNFSAYASAKAGVVRFTETVAEELKPYHIRMNAVAPGGVNTALLADILKAGKRAGRKELAAAKRREAEGGTPPELAAALVVFLVSNGSRGLTGRLVSAPWDDWRRWDKKRIARIMAGDAFTLRRVTKPMRRN